MADVEAPAVEAKASKLLPAPQLDMRRAVRLGLANAAVMVLVAARRGSWARSKPG